MPRKPFEAKVIKTYIPDEECERRAIEIARRYVYADNSRGQRNEQSEPPTDPAA